MNFYLNNVNYFCVVRDPIEVFFSQIQMYYFENKHHLNDDKELNDFIFSYINNSRNDNGIFSMLMQKNIFSYNYSHDIMVKQLWNNIDNITFFLDDDNLNDNLKHYFLKNNVIVNQPDLTLLRPHTLAENNITPISIDKLYPEIKHNLVNNFLYYDILAYNLIKFQKLL